MHGTGRIEFANTLRGFAALAVVISHYFGVFWLKREVVATVTNTPILPLANYAAPKYVYWVNSFSLLDWGAYGVALFFLISGFVIPFSLKKTSWLGFGVSRLARILPTYAVGFSLTLLSIFVGCKYFGRTWPFSLNEILIHYVPGIRDVLWSKNIDSIIWTLEIEMKFYVLCMLSIVWFRNGSIKIFLIPCALFIAAMLLMPKMEMWAGSASGMYTKAFTFAFVSQFIIFMFIGVVFHYLHSGMLSAEKSMLFMFFLFFIFCVMWQSGVFKTSFYQVWSYGFALLTFVAAFVYQARFVENRFFGFFANISYPLYVIHGVAGYVVLRVLLDLGVKGWQSLLIVTSVAIFFAWVIHKFIENPSQKLGKWISVKISGKPLSANRPVNQY